MMTYCKAYKLRDLRQFSGWKENLENARNRSVGNGSLNDDENLLTDESILYLHETFVVTDGIFGDKHIIFDKVGPEWIEFCKKKLNFAVPEYARMQSEEFAEQFN
ncbi:MAG: hypothetical protein GXO75_09360 [Calditrichaeota bacterium]|nr:hypothetical protein [Calditrichota bacterium]